MARVRIDAVSLRRGDTQVLDDVSFAVEDGELLVVLGPSGAGKSALLRVIAGLEPPDTGRIWIGADDVTDTDTAHRRIAMVFQENALYPFLDVRHNVSFPLDVAGASRDEVHARVEAEARVLAIQHLLERMPGRLSAGHQQLVQAARALVRVPEVFLMDEPLARLDAHLRVLMRREFRLLQTGYGVTTVYVTNDPEEAMAVADQVAVLDSGTLVQVGAPLVVYRRPASRTVAAMVGNPPMSFVEGVVVPDPPGFWIEVGPLSVRAWDPGLAVAGPGPVDVGVRPEQVVADPNGVVGTVIAAEHLGSHSVVQIEIAPGKVVPMRSDGPHAIGERLAIRLTGAHVFEVDSGWAVGHGPTAVS